MSEPTPCCVEGCNRPARRGGYCWGHRKQLQRAGEVGELKEPKGAARDRAGIPRRSLRAQLEDAAIDLGDANSEGDHEEYERAYHRLEMVALRKRRASPLSSAPKMGRPPTGTSRWALWRRRGR